MSAPEAPRLWQRSLWPLLLCVALPVFMLGLVVEHWLSLEGSPALIANLGIGGAAGLTVFLIIEKARKLRRERRHEAGAAAASRR